MNLSIDPDSVKGFLHPAEGARLYELGQEACALGPSLEVGSYCGKSTVYLGSGVRAGGGQLFALDHHRGSEEHQLGQEYHDSELYDEELGQMDTLPTFRRTLFRAKLEAHVIPVVASSAQLGAVWQTPLGLVFIDGGHSFASAKPISVHGWGMWCQEVTLLSTTFLPRKRRAARRPDTYCNLQPRAGCLTYR